MNSYLYFADVPWMTPDIPAPFGDWRGWHGGESSDQPRWREAGHCLLLALISEVRSTSSTRRHLYQEALLLLLTTSTSTFASAATDSYHWRFGGAVRSADISLALKRAEADGW